MNKQRQENESEYQVVPVDEEQERAETDQRQLYFPVDDN